MRKGISRMGGRESRPHSKEEDCGLSTLRIFGFHLKTVWICDYRSIIVPGGGHKSLTVVIRSLILEYHGTQRFQLILKDNKFV